MWLDACPEPRAQGFVANPGLFSPLSNLHPPLFSGLVIHSCLSVIIMGVWEGNEKEELRHRPPHCEGNVDSQPMHFNTGKPLGKPGAVPGVLGALLPSPAGLELMPSFLLGQETAGTSPPPSSPPREPSRQARAPALLLKFHKHLLILE